MVNALIVVAAVTGMTFILFLLYKYRVRRLDFALPRNICPLHKHNLLCLKEEDRLAFASLTTSQASKIP